MFIDLLLLHVSVSLLIHTDEIFMWATKRKATTGIRMTSHGTHEKLYAGWPNQAKGKKKENVPRTLDEVSESPYKDRNTNM